MEEMEQNNQKNGYWSGLISGLLLAVLLGGCIFIGSQVYRIFEAKQIAESNQAEDAELLNEYTAAKVEVIEETIQQYFLEETSRSELENGIYSGMLAALGDPYSEYYSVCFKKNIKRFNRRNSGKSQKHGTSLYLCSF